MLKPLLFDVNLVKLHLTEFSGLYLNEKTFFCNGQASFPHVHEQEQLKMLQNQKS